jgi:hypothetical protein
VLLEKGQVLLRGTSLRHGHVNGDGVVMAWMSSPRAVTG